MLELTNISIKNLADVAEKICTFSTSQSIICFVGEMGAGKTTLIKEVCRLLGVKENVSSPTYSIVNELCDSNGKQIYHFDLYRIKSSKELFDIGFEDYLFSGSLCLIEWPQIALDLLDDYLEVVLEKTDESTRKICLTLKNTN
jgi:tRNA threonylcarbamoyladenosine biosynthesis protein TsaE